MADIKLFNIKGTVKELQSGTVNLEKELQTVIEKNMNIFFGVIFLASEYRTTDGGRMDSIGIDENNSPVIFEYKRSVNESVINQGLFYLNWLLDHKDSFKVLVIEKLGLKKADDIDWSMPRVVCIANDFTKYDESAIKQMNRNISLIRYRKFEGELLMFEQVNESTADSIPLSLSDSPKKTKHIDKTFDERYSESSESIKNLYDDISKFIMTLGDDVSENRMKLYVAFKKIKNFACAELAKDKVILYLKLDPTKFQFEEGFSRNVKDIGHWGTGDIEITIKNNDDFQKAQGLIEKAYTEN